VRSGVVKVDELIKAHQSGMKVICSRSMREAAALAVACAQETVHRNRGDLRHFLAAFIGNPEVVSEIAEAGWTPTPTDIDDLRRELLEQITRSAEQGEDIAAWRRILGAGGSSAISRPVISGFTSDHAEATADHRDPLELLSDVRAFARLICLEEAEPPLSIGLFGGWGSGKSTFMQLLEREIDRLTARTRQVAGLEAGKSGPTEDGPSFVRNVVQIRFNAWHFADANLWASLTAEFFDQLRAGGFARSGKVIHTRLVERVNQHVHALTSEAATTRAALASSEEALRDAQKSRDKAVADAERAPGVAFRQTVVDVVTKSFEQHKGDLRELGRTPHADNPARDVEEFIDLAKRLRTAGGQLGALTSFVFARGWRAALALGGAVALAGGIALMSSRGGISQLNGIDLLASLAGVGALARAVLPGVKVITGLIDSTAGFATALDGELESQIKNVAQAEDALQRAAVETEARRAAAERANKALARYIDPNSSVANPPRLLRFMLEDDPDTRALEKEIGLISRVRRLFQAVDEIVREERRKGADAVDPDVPERIVIYIDDLDRCTPAQVYAVLQAIHLLLAFQLFVVVVGVDVGWI
jgi:hypothetical protein